MSTFQEVNDAPLIELLRQARRRIVFIAQGLYELGAKALGERSAGNFDAAQAMEPRGWNG